MQSDSTFGLDLEGLVRGVKKYMPALNEQKFRKAFYFAAEAHQGQTRKDGSPYIVHPFEAVRILTSLQVDEDTLIAAFLHDVPEDTNHTVREIEARFGKRTAFLVDGVTKLAKVHYQHDMAKRQIESLKKLFIHTAEDPRIILIKLADRLHNMRTLKFIDKDEKRVRISRETLEIFVPIANLLGIEELKSELEDLCFRYLFPDEYQALHERMRHNRVKNQAILDNTVKIVEEELKKNKIMATVYGRQRNVYNIYKKIVAQGKSLDEADKTIHIRILVQDKEQCYQALGIIHNLFKPKPGKFKDYIAVPKINGYQSLHSSVFGFNGITAEFQIRSNNMHLEAEYGIAVHYFNLAEKKNKRNVMEEDRRSGWVTKIVNLQKDEAQFDDFMDDLKLDVFRDRIFVFTPRGDAIDLPQDATCIDFAYEIHSEVGNRALKADINGKIVPMNTVLQNGDTVSIITSDIPKGPSRSWLAFAKTNAAKHKIRDYFKKISYEEKLRTGRALLRKEFDRAGLGSIKFVPHKKIRAFCNSYNNQYHSLDDILIAIGEGTLSTLDFIGFVYPTGKNRSNLSLWHYFERPAIKKDSFTRRPVEIKILSKDSVGQLEKILKVMSDQHINVLKTRAYVSRLTGDFVSKQVVTVNNFAQVSELFESLEHIDGVKKVERLFLHRRLSFIFGLFLTFAFWAAHPFVLQYIIEKFAKQSDPLILGIVDYIGILMLFAMVFFLRKITQSSFSELKETSIFWVMTYVLSAFALLTTAVEIYFFKLSFDWWLVGGSILAIFAYLTAGFIKFRGQNN